jgi:sugar phosphate permease
MISNWFVKKRGLVFGILAAAFGASLPSAYIAQFLISHFGWQTAYVIIGLASTVIIVPLCAFFLRRSPQEKGLMPDGILQTSHNRQAPDQLPRQTSVQQQ